MDIIFIIFELLHLQFLIIPNFIFVILGFLIPIIFFMVFVEFSVFENTKKRGDFYVSDRT